jgi:hypothetical protein
MVEGTYLITMTTPCLIFHVQRTNSTRDDVIKIHRANIDTTRYVMTYETEEEPEVGTRTMFMTEKEVLDYVRNLVTALSVDAMPFEYLQMTPPAFPPIQYRVDSLSTYSVTNNIISTVSQTLQNWPNPDNRVIPRRRRPSADSPPHTPVRRAH